MEDCSFDWIKFSHELGPAFKSQSVKHFAEIDGVNLYEKISKAPLFVMDIETGRMVPLEEVEFVPAKKEDLL